MSWFRTHLLSALFETFCSCSLFELFLAPVVVDLCLSPVACVSGLSLLLCVRPWLFTCLNLNLVGAKMSDRTLVVLRSQICCFASEHFVSILRTLLDLDAH